MDAQFLAAEVPVHWSLMKIRSNIENAAAMAFFFLFFFFLTRGVRERRSGNPF